MVKLRKISFLLPVLAVMFVALLPSGVNAAKFEVGDYKLDKQSVLEEDLYVTGENIQISGVVDGDVLVAGDNVTVDGTVTGNVYAAGNNVSINGNVYGTVTVAGSTITLDGTLGRDVIAAGLSIMSSADISQDLTVMSGMAKVSGNIGDDLRAVSGDVVSEGVIGGDFVFVGESYSVDEESVGGDIVHRIIEDSNDKIQKPVIDWSNMFATNLWLSLFSFIGMFIVGAVLIYLAPVKTLQIEEKINGSLEDTLKSLAIGLLVLFAIPLPLFLLLITFIGAPLAMMIAGILIFLTFFGVIWAEVAIGHTILKNVFNKTDDQRYLSLLVGRFLSVVIKLIPVIGALYSLTLMMLTVGAVVRTKTHALSSAEQTKSKKK